VPTAYIEPGERADPVLAQFLQQHAAQELIVKPAVGSGARDAQRYERAAVPAMLAHINRLLAAQRSALVQPYLERVDAHGECALIYIDGRFSHAIRKSAVLGRALAPVEALFAPETIELRTADAHELELGARVLAALPVSGLLYARIDLLHDEHAAPCVLELELAEPSLYLGYCAQAPRRLAGAIAGRLQEPAGGGLLGL
jgi:glutathione synthase/RimK-type ligase-like ATP-grasp enzyme